LFDASVLAGRSGGMWMSLIGLVEQFHKAHEAPCLCRTEKMMKMK
jgi:hypothetical protein